MDREWPSLRQHGDKLRFLIVGCIGFAVDGGTLMLLDEGAGWSPLLARSVSFPVAVTVTWLLNRMWTFRHVHQRAATPQYVLYLMIQLGGLAINFSVFALLIGHIAWFAAYPVAGLAVGAALALVFNFVCSVRFTFSETRHGS
ncbi:MAG: GtrA family protein [Ferrovibrio sp.]